MEHVEVNTTSFLSASAVTGDHETQEDKQTQQWHPLCMVIIDDIDVIRIPATFSKDVPMSRPTRWNAITPRGTFLVRWGPDSQDRAQTIMSQGWGALCAANGIATGTIVLFELLGMSIRLLRVSVKEEKN
ncbi:hypothetical protein PIB30_022551 [Stylosanthes scabra]|uniref:TF-B3 domain-containing protein n=1 Tax=Stylosanthes scabra TaxID=79078 RepID=A0ABU6XAY5_9FABA|nr:hypothetical protein [Stylosanthes scabra]